MATRLLAFKRSRTTQLGTRIQRSVLRHLRATRPLTSTPPWVLRHSRVIPPASETRQSVRVHSVAIRPVSPILRWVSELATTSRRGVVTSISATQVLPGSLTPHASAHCRRKPLLSAFATSQQETTTPYQC